MFIPGAVILTYHRIVDLSSDPCALAVSPDNFRRHIDYVKKTCTVLRLNELAIALQKKTLPARSIAITFDDGYVDVCKTAYPVLQCAGVPATVFVPTAAIGKKREFWWDELEHILFVPGKLPKHLDLRVKNRIYQFTTENRTRTFWQIHRILKPLAYEERQGVLDELAEWSGLPVKCRDGYRPLDEEELLRLVRTGLIEIGAHTITHTTLSALNQKEQYREIVEGRRQLTALLDTPIRTFAFPYGEEEDFTDETVEILRDTGFEAGCTMIRGSIERGVDPLCLTRFMVQNWQGNVFARKLESFFIS